MEENVLLGEESRIIQYIVVKIGGEQYGIDITLKENGVTARQGVTIIPEEDQFLYDIYKLYFSRRSSYLNKCLGII